jgi:hypothetical protein
MPVASSSDGKPWPGLGIRREVLYLNRIATESTKASTSAAAHSQTGRDLAGRSDITGVSAPLADSQRHLIPGESQAQNKTSIMDRPRGVRRSGDPAGDGTSGGFNYGYENTGELAHPVYNSPC